MEGEGSSDRGKSNGAEGPTGTTIYMQEGSSSGHAQAGRDIFEFGNVHTGGGDVNLSELDFPIRI